MEVVAPDFERGGAILKRFTADGSDVSPRLVISDFPSGTKSLALIVDDPDAPRGTFVHWVAWNIPPNLHELPEDYSPPQEGTNDFGVIGWRGPSPPPGKAHRYFFKLYALDTLLNLPVGSTKEQLESEMVGHILFQSEWMGLYQRSLK